jgi:hypothetical protein
MLILIIKTILSPLAIIADLLNMLLSFLKWDSRFIENNADSINMVWNRELKKKDNQTDVNNLLAPVFFQPFRVGRKHMRSVLDARGYEVVIFPKGLEIYAKEYADFLNSTRKNAANTKLCAELNQQCNIHIVLNWLPSDEQIADAADHWVFDLNGHKWSNNNNTAGDNYGSFKAGAEWLKERLVK